MPTTSTVPLRGVRAIRSPAAQRRKDPRDDGIKAPRNVFGFSACPWSRHGTQPQQRARSVLAMEIAHGNC